MWNAAGSPPGPRLAALSALLLSAAAGLHAPARAQGTYDQPLNGTLGLSGVSAYVWRGQVLVDDWVGQGEFKVVDNNWTLGAWTNMDLTDERAQEQKITEYRLSAAYNLALPNSRWAMRFGYVYYNYPNLNRRKTQEMFVSAERPIQILWFGLNTRITYFRDFDATDSTYITLEMKTNLNPPGLQAYGTSFDLIGTLSYGDKKFNEFTFNQLDEGLTDVTITARLPIRRSGYTIVPYISWMHVIDEELARSLDEDEIWYGGVSLVFGYGGPRPRPRFR